MMLSNSGLKCDFRGQNNPQKPNNFLGNVPSEGLYTPIFLAPIVANREIETFPPSLIAPKI